VICSYCFIVSYIYKTTWVISWYIIIFKSYSKSSTYSRVKSFIRTPFFSKKHHLRCLNIVHVVCLQSSIQKAEQFLREGIKVLFPTIATLVYGPTIALTVTFQLEFYYPICKGTSKLPKLILDKAKLSLYLSPFVI